MAFLGKAWPCSPSPQCCVSGYQGLTKTPNTQQLPYPILPIAQNEKPRPKAEQ